MRNFSRFLLFLSVPAAMYGLALSAACSSSPNGNGSSSGGSSSGGSSSGGSSSGASSGGSSSGSSSGGSSSGSSSGGSSSGSSSGNAADCGAIGYLVPTVTVASASGTPIACEATFAIADQPDSSAQVPSQITGVSCGGDAGGLQGCPADPDAGGACVYVIDGLQGSVTPFQLTVSQAGYQSVTIDGFHAGEDGCVPTINASAATATLEPIDSGSK